MNNKHRHDLNAASGLEFMFDVMTTLNVSATAFYESELVSGYDLYATASNKDDILFLNLFNGKCVMILLGCFIHVLTILYVQVKLKLLPASLQPLKTWTDPGAMWTSN